MNSFEIINNLGLFLDIIGAILIAFYGIPPKVDREGTVLLAVKKGKKEELKKAKKYDFISGLGFALLIFGFILQIISNFLQ